VQVQVVDLSGYEIFEQIHENHRIKVYRGYSLRDQQAVVIKVLKEEAANAYEVQRLIHEYEMTRNLSVEGIVSPIRLEQNGRLAAMIMKDTGAVSLREPLRRDGPFDVGRFLHIAIQLATILAEVHRNGMIHRDVHPGNILISPDDKRVYLIDFSKAAFMSPDRSNPQANHPQLFGSPEYMAPEQTGRLRAFMDQRSDLYSLGVVFYQMVTGTFPFQGEHAADWVYVHLTHSPKAPHKMIPDLPQTLSAIIMKLLKKDPDERYQSAYGLLKDLGECQRQWLETGTIAEVPVGEADDAARFRLPATFYGRHREMKLLQAAFDRVCEGEAETIFVSGEPGIGKTSLIHESLKKHAGEKGFFVSGKADQLRTNLPYAPFAHAFGRLIRQLLTEDEEKLLWWKKRIRESLGKNGAVMLEIIPELEWMIGKQPPLESLAPQEAENRFQRVFRDFIRGFAWKDHPLVLFLDDLQWADDASIRLLNYLMMRDTKRCPLLIVGAFRENELGDGHLLHKLLADAQNNALLITRLHLLPLERSEIARIVAETLHAPLEHAASLSESLYHWSGGNPFALKQHLALLHDEGALYFDHQEGCWKWDRRAFCDLHQREDVLALLVTKIQRLSEEGRELLKLASCLGNRFDLQTVAALWGKSAEEAAAGFMALISEGLVAVAENEKEGQVSVHSDRKNVEFAFLHDHIQQAVHSLIGEHEKKETHLKIGTLLLENVSGHPRAERFMSMMDHFNRSPELIHDRKLRNRLARLNLLAGRKAKASAAYASALQYFRSGIAFLPDDAWETLYRLSFRLHLELAQAKFLCADVGKAEERFDTLLKKARTELERADVYGAKVILYTGTGKYPEAVQTGRKALQNLGMRIPLHPTKWDYVKELLRYKWLMRNRRIDDLMRLPELREARRKKIMELSTRLSYVCMTSYPDLFGLIIIKNGNYAVRYGNNEMSPAAYLGYGLTEGNILGDYRKGEKYSRLCIRLAEKYDRSSIKCIIYFVTASLLFHWSHHASYGLAYLNKAVECGMEAGDVVIVGYAHCLLLENRYLMGVPLAEMKEQIRQKRQVAETIKHDNLAVNTLIYDRVVSALMGGQPGSLESVAQKLESEEPLFTAQKDKTVLATYYLCLMQLYCFMGKPGQALAIDRRIQPLRGAMNGLFITGDYTLLQSLTLAAVYEQLSPAGRFNCWRQLNKNKRLLRKWASSCKDNFEHKYLLAAAEMARLRNKNEEAMRLYDHAVAFARNYGYLQYEALANELAARFYLALAGTKIAGMYMREACRTYRRWGAHAKVKQLEEQYPELLKEHDAHPEEHERIRVSERMENFPPGDEMERDNGLDAYFIDEALETIAKETDIDQLLEKFLAIVMQSVGADRGCLIFEKNGELYVEALKDICSAETVIQTIPLAQVQDLSKAVVQYVARTLETVVINRGEPHGIFASDPYLAESGPKSIASIPLLLQGVPFGVLYLENNVMPGLFDPRHLKVVHLLSTQIALMKKMQSFLEGNTAPTGGGDDADLTERLTERELEVLKLMGRGLSNREIGEKLEMSVNTVKTHIKNIYGKLGVSRRVQAVQRAKEHRLL
jgi:predicted ATPase/DNA-binding CsgD family transcriptional regulator/GAF domain-containing protein